MSMTPGLAPDRGLSQKKPCSSVRTRDHDGTAILLVGQDVRTSAQEVAPQQKAPQLGRRAGEGHLTN
jgi:hypothetical protein